MYFVKIIHWKDYSQDKSLEDILNDELRNLGNVDVEDIKEIAAGAAFMIVYDKRPIGKTNR